MHNPLRTRFVGNPLAPKKQVPFFSPRFVQYLKDLDYIPLIVIASMLGLFTVIFLTNPMALIAIGAIALACVIIPLIIQSIEYLIRLRTHPQRPPSVATHPQTDKTTPHSEPHPPASSRPQALPHPTSSILRVRSHRAIPPDLPPSTHTLSSSSTDLSLTLRRMTSNDIARITAIEAVCFPIDQWGQKTLARCISHSQLHCRALIKNTPTPRGIRQDIVGYAIYKIDLLYNTPDRHHTASWEGHLMCIAIAPEHQRQGYGRWLLNQLIMEITQTPGVIRITLEVRETNARAQKLYQSVGFQASSRTPAYYLPQAPGASPEAAIIMTRDTPPRSATHQATPRARNAA